MRMLCVWTVQVLLCFLCTPLVLLAEEYDLNGLYKLALERSELIRIAGQNVTYSEMEKRRAVALLLPRLSAFTSWYWFTEEKHTTEQVMTFTSDILVQPKSSNTWGVRADESLSLSLREITAVRMGTNDILRSRYDLDAVKESYLLEVAQAYYRVLMAKKGLDIATSNLDRVSRYRDAAQARLNVGEITETVLLRADSELSSARSDLVKAENSLALTKASLARLVGVDTGITLREGQPREAQTASLPELKAIAYDQRPDLKSLEYQVKIASQQVSFARGAYWPDFCISGVFQRADQEPMSSTLNQESTYGAVSLVFPFFEGGRRRAEVQQAKVRESQAALRFEDQKKAVALEVERAYLDLMTSKGTIDFLANQLAFAQDNYRGVTRQFSQGLASSIDVIDANSLLVSSERQLAEASYSYQLAILDVEQATGTFMRGIQAQAKSVQ